MGCWARVSDFVAGNGTWEPKFLTVPRGWIKSCWFRVAHVEHLIWRAGWHLKRPHIFLHYGPLKSGSEQRPSHIRRWVSRHGDEHSQVPDWAQVWLSSLRPQLVFVGCGFGYTAGAHSTSGDWSTAHKSQRSRSLDSCKRNRAISWRVHLSDTFREYNEFPNNWS